MKDNSEFDNLVVSYLLKELNEADEARLKRLLESDEQLRGDFEKLVETDRLLAIKKDIDRIDVRQEWNRLQEKWVTRQDQWQPEPVEDDSYSAEIEETGGRRNAYRFMRRLAVAASVIFLAGIGWLIVHFSNTHETVNPAVTGTTTDKSKFFLHTEQNNTGKAKDLLLEDGSRVLLWDQSAITYAKPFGDSRRDISLVGKGFFKVARDETKPFKVYSGDISTTAIGTQFFVTNFETEQVITVRLVEGKVVIESVDSARVKLKKPVYLLPGQELVYNKVTGEVNTIQSRRRNAPSISSDSPSVDNPSMPTDTDGSWYMFNNQSLTDIFDQLESMFGTNIEYNPKDVQKLYFIGKFDKKDSLEYILKYITSINNLKFQKENNKYIITKQ